MSPFEKLCDLRWPNGIECPHCGCRKVYFIGTRERLKCARKGCRKCFSPTSGTIFRSRKMPIYQYLNAIAAFPSCKGPHEMHRVLKTDYKTAFNIFHALKCTDGKLL